MVVRARVTWLKADSQCAGFRCSSRTQPLPRGLRTTLALGGGSSACQHVMAIGNPCVPLRVDVP